MSVSTKRILGEVLEGYDASEENLEVLRKLQAFRAECDRQSPERWNGYELKSFMEWVSGLEIDDRTFTRWKAIAGISATRKRYGHGSFVLATAIGRLKKAGQKVVTPSNVLSALSEVDSSLGIRIMKLEATANSEQSVESSGKEPIEGRRLPVEVAKINGIQKNEKFYYRHFSDYERRRLYTWSEVIHISFAVKQYCYQRKNGKGTRSK